MPTIPALVLAVEEEASGLDLVLPDTAELLWGAVGFAILLAFLWGRIFPALNRVLAERQARIQGQLEEAETTRTEAEQVRGQYQAQLADARNQANVIVEEARKQGDRLKADIVGKAEEEAGQIVAKAREDAEGARTRVISDLRGQVATASVELAGRIVQRELDPERHRALVDQYINELSGLN
jgi:F-type H+-transporting ATPase subunit b